MLACITERTGDQLVTGARFTERTGDHLGHRCSVTEPTGDLGPGARFLSLIVVLFDLPSLPVTSVPVLGFLPSLPVTSVPVLGYRAYR